MIKFNSDEKPILEIIKEFLEGLLYKNVNGIEYQLKGFTQHLIELVSIKYNLPDYEQKCFLIHNHINKTNGIGSFTPANLFTAAIIYDKYVPYLSIKHKDVYHYDNGDIIFYDYDNQMYIFKEKDIEINLDKNNDEH